MAPRTKQQLHCKAMVDKRKSNREQKEIKPNPKIHPKLMATTGLLTGNGYVGMKRNCNYLNIPTPSMRTYYNYQRDAAENIIDIVGNNCLQNATKIQNNSNISTDGQWNHQNNGSNALITFFDHEQGKVVHFENISRNKGIFGGNYEGASSNMETAGIERGLTNLKPIIKDKMVNIAHDHDGKTSGIIKRRTDLQLSETLDPGHAAQEIGRKANKHFEDLSRNIKNKKDPERKTIKKCFELFATLIEKIISWFKFLVYNVQDPEIKEKQWNNMANHVTGKHDECVHANQLINQKRRGRPRKKDSKKESFWEWEAGKKDDELKKSLEVFLVKNTDLVVKTGTAQTQVNESINAMATKVLPKNKVFNNTSKARLAVAIGRKNDSNFDSKLLKSTCSDYISPCVLNEIKNDEEIRKRECLRSNTPSERKKKNAARRKFRQSHKNVDGDYKKKS